MLRGCGSISASRGRVAGCNTAEVCYPRGVAGAQGNGMRRLLATSGAVIGTLAGSGARGDGIQLHVGGEFNAAYMAVFDDDGEGEPGNERNTDGLFQDAEIHFTGSTVLDNGLEAGARVELAGEDDPGRS